MEVTTLSSFLLFVKQDKKLLEEWTNLKEQSLFRQFWATNT